MTAESVVATFAALMPKRPEFPFVIITRYAMSLSFSEGRHKDPAWLAERRVLLERYCLPWMLAQTDQHFVWLFAVDPETPLEEREYLRQTTRQSRVVGARTTRQLQRRLRRLVSSWAGPRDTVMTVRLDSDDSIAHDFVERMRGLGRDALKAVRASGRPRGFGFTTGCDHDVVNDRWAKRSEAYSQFLGLLSPTSLSVTVLETSHSRLFTQYDFFSVVTEEPMWCTRVHGGNVGNDARHMLKAPAEPFERFATAPAPWVPPEPEPPAETAEPA